MKFGYGRIALFLFTLACSAPWKKQGHANAEAVAADLQSLKYAVLLYAVDLGELPSSWASLTSSEYPFIDQLPVDPWGNEYYMDQVAGADRLTLGSYGRDNQPGGTGEDADAEVAVRFGQGIGER